MRKDLHFRRMNLFTCVSQTVRDLRLFDSEHLNLEDEQEVL